MARSTHLLSLAICLSCFAAEAANWVKIAQTEKVSYSVDANSIVKTDKVRRAWILEDGHDGRNMFVYGSRLQLGVFNCAEKSMAVKQYVLYVEGNAKGPSVGERIYKDSELEFSQVVPESVGELLLKTVCR